MLCYNCGKDSLVYNNTLCTECDWSGDFYEAMKKKIAEEVAKHKGIKFEDIPMIIKTYAGDHVCFECGTKLRIGYGGQKVCSLCKCYR